MKGFFDFWKIDENEFLNDFTNCEEQSWLKDAVDSKLFWYEDQGAKGLIFFAEELCSRYQTSGYEGDFLVMLPYRNFRIVNSDDFYNLFKILKGDGSL